MGKQTMTKHSAHPRCVCGKAMYKWMGKHAEHANKSPSPAMPYAYCRNAKCELFGANQSEATPQKVPKGKRKAKSKPQRPLCAGCGKVECACPPEEHEAVTKARARIRQTLGGNGAYAHSMIGLTLTVMAQEIGNKSIANQLIDEYKLTELFGITKIE